MLFSDIKAVRASGLPLSVLETATTDLFRADGFKLHGSATCEKLGLAPIRTKSTPVGALVFGACECAEADGVWSADVEAYLEAALFVLAAEMNTVVLVHSDEGYLTGRQAAEAAEILTERLFSLPAPLVGDADTLVRRLVKVAQSSGVEVLVPSM